MIIGYIMHSRGYRYADQDKKWMNEFGCSEIVEEQPEYEVLRPEWLNLKKKLKSGDIIVVSSFANIVRSSVNLNFLLETCIKCHIRMVSIHDRIDTEGKLFKDTTVLDLLNTIATLPTAIIEERRVSDKPTKTTVGKKKLFLTSIRNRAQRNELIVNMYNNGYSIDDIWMASGFRSRSSIFKTLNKLGIELVRGKTRGPLGQRKNVCQDIEHQEL